MEVNLDPAGRLFDALSGVIGTPAFDKTHAKDAKATEIIHTDTGGRRQTDGRCNSSHRSGTRDVSRHCGCLRSSCCLRSRCLLLHLSVTLTQIKHLDVCTGVNLVYCISRSAAGLTVQIVALDEDGMIAETTNPNVSFTFTFQLDALSYMQSRPLDGLRSVDVTQLAETESISS